MNCDVPNMIIKERKRITVAHAENVIDYPPVISLLQNLLANGHTVKLVSSSDLLKLPFNIREHDHFRYCYVENIKGSGLKNKIDRNFSYKFRFRKAVQNCMEDSEVLWTTTDVTVKLLGRMVLNYRHIMQLMELIQSIPLLGHSKHISFPIDVYARKAEKVVVPQIDRAYIQKIWWDLSKVPYVLPNKPYINDFDEILPEMDEALKSIKNEKRKIIIYLGIVGPDRNIEEFADAIKNMPDYCIYLLGRPAFGADEYLDMLLRKCPNIIYLGFYPTPKHLAFLQYAYIGLMPYTAKKAMHYSELNALYCAPNKIFEYAAYGIPMIGSDVLGLRQPIEKYNIGVCCTNLNKEEVMNAVKIIEENHEIMSDNCSKFYNSVDLDSIVEKILYDDT